MPTSQLRIYVPPHPLIKHWLAIARDVATPMPLFRTALQELGRWLTYEVSREWLPTLAVSVQTPLAETGADIIDGTVPLAIVPILRAGLALMEGAQAVLSNARVYHIGMVRNEETLEPHCYLNRLPQTFAPGTRILIPEPMLATGGTMVGVLAELASRGADLALVRIITVLAAPPALQRLGATYPMIEIYAATIDEALNEHGYIVPGLGDAGDRAFGTE